MEEEGVKEGVVKIVKGKGEDVGKNMRKNKKVDMVYLKG